MIDVTCGSYGARDGKEVMKLMIHYVDITLEYTKPEKEYDRLQMQRFIIRGTEGKL